MLGYLNKLQFQGYFRVIHSMKHYIYIFFLPNYKKLKKLSAVSKAFQHQKEQHHQRNINNNNFKWPTLLLSNLIKTAEHFIRTPYNVYDEFNEECLPMT